MKPSRLVGRMALSHLEIQDRWRTHEYDDIGNCYHETAIDDKFCCWLVEFRFVRLSKTDSYFDSKITSVYSAVRGNLEQRASMLQIDVGNQRAMMSIHEKSVLHSTFNNLSLVFFLCQSTQRPRCIFCKLRSHSCADALELYTKLWAVLVI